MSDDLISKGNTIENLCKILKIWNGNECLVSFQTVIDYMNSQSTAYDVDKVCKKINENKEIDNLIDTDYAIKIVKSGGVAND